MAEDSEKVQEMGQGARPEYATWMPLADAAKRAGVHPRTIRRAIGRGTVRGEQSGGPRSAWSVRWEDVERHYGASAAQEPAATMPATMDWVERLWEDAAEARADRDRALADAARWRTEAARMEALLTKRQRRRLAELRDQDKGEDQ